MSDTHKKRILLIDDDTSLLITLGDFLAFEGYDVVTAESGEQGLKKLAAGMTPDLIILDMSMPGMGGIGFLKEISVPNGAPKFPVLVLTARANMAEFFADVEVDGFVAKPCDPSDLLMEVSRIVFLRSGAAAEKQEGLKPRAKKTALVGDDDAVERERLMSALSAQAFIVDGAKDGPDLLEKAIVERPDVIISRLVLRGMNGDAVARTLRDLPKTKNTPIVIYHDNPTDGAEDKVGHMRLGGVTFVNRYSVDAVVSAVKAAVGV